MKSLQRFSIFIGLLILSVAASAQTGIIKGRVSDKLSNEPIPFANVVVIGSSTGATTDLDGNYEITGLEAKLYNLKVSFVGYNDIQVFEIQALNSKPTVLDFQLEAATAALEAVTVKASPFKKTAESPVSLRTIGVTEIARNPGGNRDISRVIQSLPGVTAIPGFRNDLIIRGGAPNENRFYLDEVEVPNINHFTTQGASGGSNGLLNVTFLKEVDFYSAAFPANRGNALSSVFNFRQKDGRDDKWGLTGTVGSSDFGVTAEGPLSKKTTFLFSARRSYLQYLFKAIGLPFLPTYNDFQLKVKTKIDDKNEISIIGLGALDQFNLDTTQRETENQRYILDFLPVSPQWNYTNGLVYKHYEKNGYWTFVLSRNMLNNVAYKYLNNDEKAGIKTFDYKSQEIENKLRIEHTTRKGGLKLTYGVAYEYAKYNNKTFQRFSDTRFYDYQSAFNFHKYGLFAQVSQNFLDDKLVLSGGIRADGASYSDNMSNPLQQLSPRFSLAYALTPRLAFNFNTGIYYQLPSYTTMGFQRNGVFINQESLKYIKNTQFVGGFEYNTKTDGKFTIEGFYKLYDNYPFLTDSFRQITLANLGGDYGVVGNEPARSQSAGRTFGIEGLYQQRLYKGFYGIIAYTFGKSEFEDKNGDYVPSSWDTRHILAITGGYQFKRNIEVGLKWRFQTGIPYTPDDPNSNIVAIWNNNGRALPDFNRLNTARTQSIALLDIRVDKKWYGKRNTFNLYFDIQNLLGAAVSRPQTLLDRPIDANGKPIGDAPTFRDANGVERYQTKTISDSVGSALPSLGLQIEF